MIPSAIRNLGKSEVLLRKNDISSLCHYTSPTPSKSEHCFPPYQIYVSGMSNTWATTW